MYYIFVENDEIIGKGQARCLNLQNIEVSEELYNDYETDKYIYSNGAIVPNPNYAEIKQQEEQDRVNRLTMTALDFINVLKTAGLTALQIKEYLDANIELDQQLKYCQNVYCGVVKQLCPLSLGDVTITADEVEKAFKLKNGEQVAN